MMEREIGYYIIYAFLPSLMCVLLSWASFWIKLSVAPARVALGITTYLSIKTLAFTFQNGMPRNRSNVVILSKRRTLVHSENDRSHSKLYQSAAF